MDYKNKIIDFRKHLIDEEKSQNTIDKYLRDIRLFYSWFDITKHVDVTKEVLLLYKKYLKDAYKKTSSVNSKISSINAYFTWTESDALKIKVYKCQKSLFGSEDKKLSPSDVRKLIEASNNERNKLIIETISRTGIRVSELSYITVASLNRKKSIIYNKGKERVVLIPTALSVKLSEFCKTHKINQGSVFVTNRGNPIDRKQVWKIMKDLCDKAGVDKEKVFPHNLRHLFAREYFKENKDIVKLASILGHSSIETTRIYAMETEEECREKIENLNFIRLRE